jgi:hypothetical protein
VLPLIIRNLVLVGDWRGGTCAEKPPSSRQRSEASRFGARVGQGHVTILLRV